MRAQSIAQGRALDIHLPHLKLAAKMWGPEGGPGVLAMHGWLDNASSFDLVAPRLPGLCIVAVDLPGHGLSQHYPPGSLYAFMDAVADMDAVIHALGWSRCGLLGHSRGAGIAPLLAAARPGQIDRIALLDGLGPVTDPPAAAPAAFARSLAHQRRSRTAARIFENREAAAARLVAASRTMSMATARILVERGTTNAGSGGVRWRADPRLRVPSRLRLSEDQVHAFLAAVECPTLLIRAQSGLQDERRQFAGRVAQLPSIEVHEIPGGHHVHLDDPEPVVALLRPFFAPMLAQARRE
ncbi:MAG: alpha/beta hydrolase [Nannocystaceae bacterium]